MVAVGGAYGTDRAGRWVGYLTVSVCINALLVMGITLDLPETPVTESTVLQISLKTRARAATVPPVAVPDLPPPAQPIPEAVPVLVETVEHAEEKVAPPVAMAPFPRRKPTLAPTRPHVKSRPTDAPTESKASDTRDMDLQSTTKAAPRREKTERRPDTMLASLAAGDTGPDDSTVIHEARYRHQTPPVYPRRSLDLGQQGAVTLHAQVLADGNPGVLKVAQSSGHRLLDKAAVAAVRKWKFEPTRIEGKTAASWVRVSVNFVIR